MGWDFGGGFGMAQTSGPFTLSGWAVDGASGGVGLGKIDAFVNGALVQTWQTPTFSMTWGSAETPAGTYVVQLVASDLLGNADAVSKVIVIDKTAPKPSLLAPAPNGVIDRASPGSGTIHITGLGGTGTSTDFVTHIRYFMRLDGTDRELRYQAMKPGDREAYFSWTPAAQIPSGVPVGVYAIAYDIFGRSTSTAVANVTVIGKPCDVRLRQPVDAELGSKAGGLAVSVELSPFCADADVDFAIDGQNTIAASLSNPYPTIFDGVTMLDGLGRSSSHTLQVSVTPSSGETFVSEFAIYLGPACQSTLDACTLPSGGDCQHGLMRCDGEGDLRCAAEAVADGTHCGAGGTCSSGTCLEPGCIPTPSNNNCTVSQTSPGDVSCDANTFVGCSVTDECLNRGLDESSVQCIQGTCWQGCF